MNIGYIRTSKTDKSEKHQMETLSKFGIEKWFRDLMLEKDDERVGYKSLIDFAREGDTIYICDFSRIARSMTELLSVIGILEEKKIHIVSVKEDVDTSVSVGVAKLSMINSIAEFERTNLLEKQKEGIAAAKKEGKYMGRQPAKVNKEMFDEAYSEYMSRQLTKAQFADKVGITRPTLDKFIKAYETNSLSQTEDSYYVDPNK